MSVESTETENKHIYCNLILQALCCVDKKGILSWPNPTAEKVFFLRNAQEISPALRW